MDRHPRALTADEADELTRESVEKVKHIDCSHYNACLDQAVKGNWPGFGCDACAAYTPMDIDEKVNDLLALRACYEASENLATLGKVNRTRGVKPGADASKHSRAEWEMAAKAK